MAGADLAGEVSHRRAVRRARRSASKRFTVAALDLGIKAMTPHRLAERGIEVHVLPADRRRSTTCSPCARRRVLLQRPRRPGRRRPARSTLLGEVLERGCRSSASASATSSSGGRSGFGTYKLSTATAASTSRCMDRTHRQGRGHRAQPRVRRRRAARRRDRHAVRPGRGQPRLPQRRRRRGPATASTSPAFSVQYHPEAAAGPHDAGYLFDRFADLMATGGRALMPKRDDIKSRPGHRLRARSSSARPASSTTPAPRPAGCCGPRACGSSWSTPTRPRS